MILTKLLWCQSKSILLRPVIQLICHLIINCFQWKDRCVQKSCLFFFICQIYITAQYFSFLFISKLVMKLGSEVRVSHVTCTAPWSTKELTALLKDSTAAIWWCWGLNHWPPDSVLNFLLRRKKNKCVHHVHAKPRVLRSVWQSHLTEKQYYKIFRQDRKDVSPNS